MLQGIEAFGFDMILDIYSLLLPPNDRRRENRIITNGLVKSFSTFHELNQYANKTVDTELLGKIRIVKTYTNAIPSHIAKIRSKALNSMENAGKGTTVP